MTSLLEGVVLSMNVGLPSVMFHSGREIITGIMKKPVQGAIKLTRNGISGDGQADLKHHGGPDKAVCVYDFDRYAFFEQEMNRTLDYGAFGENITIQGALEDQVCIGDVFRLGTSRMQISQPRQPCFKLAARYEWKTLPLLFQETGYTGYYFRVLEEGTAATGDKLHLEDRQQDAITVLEANVIMHQMKDDTDAAIRLLAIDSLADSWKQTLTKRLK